MHQPTNPLAPTFLPLSRTATTARRAFACSTIALCIAAADGAAQTSRVLPTGYARMFAGNNGTGTGLGSPKSIVQVVNDAPFPTGFLITTVGFRRNGSATDYAAFSLDVEVVVSSTTASTGSLSATFATNLGNDATAVFPRQVVNIPARTANDSPGAWIDFPASQPWQFQGPNLLVQVKTFAPTWTTIPFRMDRCFQSTGGNAIDWGTGCGTATATSSGTYLPGNAFTVSLANAPVQVPATLLFGADATQHAGVPLPFDLGTIGAPGCRVLVAPTVLLPQTTNGSGAASLNVTIPNVATLAEQPIGFQWLYPAPGSPAGIATTAARLVNVGPIPCANRYVYDLFDETKVTGTLQAGGPIVRLLTLP